MSLGDHIDELRKRLILAVLGGMIGIGIGLCYASSVIAWLRAPYEKVMREANLDTHLQTITPTDGFTSYMQIAMWSGLVLASPWIIYQLWKFVSAGLYPKEKRYVYLAAPASAILFILGVMLSVMVITPLTLQFLVTFNKDWLGIVSAFTFQSYMSFMVNMMLAFGLSFETPIVMFFLNKFGLLSLSLITQSRRYVILAIVVIAAILTPGSDLISLAALAIPLYMLFELGVLLIWLFGKRA
ncbi:MAG: twin-arginine translocase subunit TatC [Sedimentisphaerales bacterium]|nr:twin-arginine translocase subunit TatC [Sedimentisphaerales bacterium]